MASVPDTCDIGLIGLAVMGENLVLNMESKGFSVAVYNRTNAVTEKFGEGRAKEKNIKPTSSVEDFVESLKRPRKAMIMVKAGGAVDAVIDQLVPLLEPRRPDHRRRQIPFSPIPSVWSKHWRPKTSIISAAVSPAARKARSKAHR